MREMANKPPDGEMGWPRLRRGEIRNPKSEIRIKVEIQTRNDPNLREEFPVGAFVLDFLLAALEFVSDFGIRISDLVAVDA